MLFTHPTSHRGMHCFPHSHGHTLMDRRLAIALGLILASWAARSPAASSPHSLALLADAGHMLTDAAALAAALVAPRSRPGRRGGAWTFGFGRAEILAAQATGSRCSLVALWIVYSAVRRLISPPAVHGGIVLVVALAGVAVNLVGDVRARGADRASLNVRGAFLHVATDLAAFVGDRDRGRARPRHRLGSRSTRSPACSSPR